MQDWIKDFFYRLKKLRNQEWGIVGGTIAGLIVAGLVLAFAGGGIAAVFSLGVALPVLFAKILGAIVLIAGIISYSTYLGDSLDFLLSERTIPGLIIDGLKKVFSPATSKEPSIISTSEKHQTSTRVFTAIGLAVGTGFGIAAVAVVSLASAGVIPAIVGSLGLFVGGGLSIFFMGVAASGPIRRVGQVFDRMYDNRTIFDWLYDSITGKKQVKQEVQHSVEQALRRDIIPPLSYYKMGKVLESKSTVTSTKNQGFAGEKNLEVKVQATGQSTVFQVSSTVQMKEKPDGLPQDYSAEFVKK